MYGVATARPEGTGFAVPIDAGAPPADQRREWMKARPPYPEEDFVRAWLRKKERAARRRLAWQVLIAAITMIAACIAAWPVIKDWIK